MTDSLWRKRQEPEALKLALEALEEIALAGMSGTGQESDEAMTAWHARQAWKFIGIAARQLTTIKEALAQPEPYDQTALELCNVCGWKTLIPDDACLNCERAQPEQEPVAWMYESVCGNGFATRHKPPDYGKNIRPLYTTSPRRTWVGLTDGDIKAVNAQVSQIPPIDYTTTTYAKAIEAKLRSKNDTY